MIKEIDKNELDECVNVIRESFLTVADEFGFTVDNAPRFTAFATSRERLEWHLNGEHRPMYAFYDNGTIVGYYSLLLQENHECELNNLCVLPTYRYKKIGEKLLESAFKVSKELNCTKMNIGIVEENKVLRNLISFLLLVDIWKRNYKKIWIRQVYNMQLQKQIIQSVVIG